MRKLTFLSAIAGIVIVSALPAAANGCNGVVSQLEWGCAAWDNNNGPQFPHYNKTAAPARPAASQVMGNGNGLVASGGGNLVASGGGNLVASGGGNLVASGGGNRPNH